MVVAVVAMDEDEDTTVVVGETIDLMGFALWVNQIQPLTLVLALKLALMLALYQPMMLMSHDIHQTIHLHQTKVRVVIELG